MPALLTRMWTARPCRSRPAGVDVGHVERQRIGLVAARADRRRGRLDLGLGARRERHMGAGGCERRGRRQPDAASAAGDEGTAAVQAKRGRLGQFDGHSRHANLQQPVARMEHSDIDIQHVGPAFRSAQCGLRFTGSIGGRERRTFPSVLDDEGPGAPRLLAQRLRERDAPGLELERLLDRLGASTPMSDDSRLPVAQRGIHHRPATCGAD